MTQFKQCLKNCACHDGARYDQIECICPAWCGNEEFDYVLKEESEPYKIMFDIGIPYKTIFPKGSAS